MIQIETHILEDLIPEIKLEHNEQLEMFTDMLRINIMEKHLNYDYNKNNIRGFCHLVLGQEGLYAVLKKVIKEDLLISSYRCHGAGYAAGIGVKEIICENLGTKKGNSGGKGGSMHLYNDKFFGGHGIVGAQVPLGAGLAFAIKYKNYQKSKVENLHCKKDNFISCKSDAVSFVIYGDGASNQGQIYETFNMAKVYNLPIVFIVENNKYGMYTPIENVSVDDCFYKRGYNIPGIRVADEDIELLYSAVVYAKSYSLCKGPIIVQVDTNRSCGHSTLDKDQPYRKKNDKNISSSLKNLSKKIGLTESEKIKENLTEEFKQLLSTIDYLDFPSIKDLYTDLFFDLE